VGKNAHDTNVTAASSGPTTSSSRRDTASAQTPDGTSRTRLLPDQMTNRDVICQTDRPVSAKSSAYTG
jgi:hypothetical protein